MYIYCPHCNQKLKPDDDLTGIEVECPTCGQPFIVSADDAPETQSSVAEQESETERVVWKLSAVLNEHKKKAYRLSSPAILLLILTFFLPFMNMSCNGRKMIRGSIHEVITADSSNTTDRISEVVGEESLDNASSPKALWIPVVSAIIIVACGIALTVLSFYVYRRPKELFAKIGFYTALAGLIATLGLGAYVGLYLESFINKAMTEAAQQAEAGMEQTVAMGMMSMMKLSVNMDAAFYLILATFVLGLLSFVLPRLWQNEDTPSLIKDTLIGSSGGLALLFCLAMTIITMASTAQFSDFDKLGTESSNSTPSDEIEATKISIGQIIKLEDFVKFSFVSAGWPDEIRASDPSGAHHFMSAQKGETSYVLQGKIKNISGSSYEIDNVDATMLINDKYEYNANLIAEEIDGSGLNISGHLSPLQETTFYIYADIPDELKNRFNKCVTKVRFDEDFSYYGDDDKPDYFYSVVTNPKVTDNEQGKSHQGQISDFDKLGTESSNSTPSDEIEATKISIGQIIKLEDFVKFSFVSAGWPDEIRASDPSGVHYWMSAQKGETAYVLQGKIKNISGSSYQIDNVDATMLINDKYEYNANLIAEEIDGSGLDYGCCLSPLQETTFYIYADIPDELKNRFNKCVTKVRFDDKPDYFYSVVTNPKVTDNEQGKSHQGQIKTVEETLSKTRKLKDDFLGLHLGCSPAEAQKVIADSEKQMQLYKKDQDGEIISYLYYGNHRLSDADGTILMFWQGKLKSIGVKFSGEDAELTYKVLNKAVKECYGKGEEKIVFRGKKRRYKHGLMYIEVEYEKRPSEPDTSFISAYHTGLAAAKHDKGVEDKAEDLGNL